MQITPTRSYRCFFAPKDGFGNPVASESGVLPFVQLKAANGEHAQRAAHHVTGSPVVSVERIEASRPDMRTAAQAPRRAAVAAPAQIHPHHAQLADAIARRQADMARARIERPTRIAAQRQATLYRELACEGRA